MAKITVNNPKNVINSKIGKNYFKLVGTGGPKGDKGDKGDTGAAATISAGTASSLPAGSSPTVTNSGTSSAAVFNFGIPKGDKGDKGDTGATGAAATITVGSTTTGAAGTNASVTNTGTSGAAVLNFTIPRGNKGETGATGATGQAATIAVGSTTTLAPGSNATVTNSGTSSAATFNFGIPQGAKGDTGATGKVQSVYVSELPASGDDNTFYLVDKNIQTQTASGSNVNFTNNKNYGSLWLDQLTGNATQNGTPTPDAPVAVNTTTGENVVKITGKNLVWDGWAEDFVTRVNNADRAKIETFDGKNCVWWRENTGYGDYDNKYIFKTNFQPNTQYTLSCDLYPSTNFPLITFRFTDNTSQRLEDITPNQWNHVVATSTEGKTVKYIQIAYYSGNVYCDIDTFQLELGSTATAYEPYQGQEYQIDLSSKNLFDKNAVSTGKIIERTDGTLTNNASYDTSDFMPVKAGEKYTYTGFNVWYASYYDTNKAFVSTPNNSTTITIPTGVAYVRCSLLHTNLDTAQFEHRTQATTYAEFYNYELAKIGTYQDRIYKNDGKWYIEKQITKLDLSTISASSWASYASGNNTVFYSTVPNAQYGSASSNPIISDRFISEFSATNGRTFLSGSQMRINFCTNVANTGGDWITWLGTHPTTVYYALATPTTTEITEQALIDQLNFVASLYPGVNNIVLLPSAGAQGTMDISYQLFDQYNKHNVYIWNDDINDWQIIMQ